MAKQEWKEYPSTHKELWQRFCQLEGKPQPYHEPEDVSLFWLWVCFALTVAALLAAAWWWTEPIGNIFPNLRG